MAMADHWLGLDFGTSSVKAVLLDDSGATVSRANAEYPTVHGKLGEAEQDPSAYVRAAREVIEACGERSPRGIGLSGQTPSLVFVSERGEAVGPAIIWQDHRAHAEAAELAMEFGSSHDLFGTNVPWTPAFPAAKLLWLTRNQPAMAQQVRWLLQPKDYIGMLLTGDPCSDPWSTKGLSHVGTYAPVEAVFDRVGWNPALAPPLRQAWESRGTVNSIGASAFGFAEGIPVSVGWTDALSAMLAVGAFSAPTAFILAGTSSIVGVSTAGTAAPSPELLTVPNTCAPLSVCYGPTESSGASLQWIARLLGCDVAGANALAADALERGAEVPVFTPYLSGERAPVWRSDVRGGFLGLSAEDGPAELALSVVLGVAGSEADVLARAEDHAGVHRAAVVRVAGRGAADQPWSGGRSAMLGRDLEVLDESYASAVGAAMLGVAAAHDGDLGAAFELEGPRWHRHPASADRSPALLDAYRRAALANVENSGRLVRQ